ncbi:MAG: beta-N-acetylhexosaminidase [Pseudomonadota bacterium]
MSGPLIVGIDGAELSAETREMLMHPTIGGIILFTRNYADPDQLRSLTRELRQLRKPRLLLMVDQEGGRVQRLRNAFTALPPLSLLGRWYQSHPQRALDMAYRHARVMAAEVLAVGVDMSLAPVIDLNRGSSVIGDRAFSSEPEEIIELAGHYLAGMHDAGMKTCGKHYPGHGSVEADSHFEIVQDERSLLAIEQDLQPFIALHGKLDSIMPAHVCYQSADDRPAGFSHFWIQQKLREQIGYRGVVISDDLDMAGATIAGTMLDRWQSCHAAGCDLALVCRPESVAPLLDELDALHQPLPDTSASIRKLYGRAAFAFKEQLTVPEFRAWRDSLNRLSEAHSD